MHTENALIFKLSAFVGAMFNLFGLQIFNTGEIGTLLQITSFSNWAFALSVKLFELALAGLVTGYCGIAGKKLYERYSEKQKLKESSPEDKG